MKDIDVMDYSESEWFSDITRIAEKRKKDTLLTPEQVALVKHARLNKITWNQISELFRLYLHVEYKGCTIKKKYSTWSKYENGESNPTT